MEAPVQVRLSPDELAEIDAVRAAAGMSRAELVRTCIRLALLDPTIRQVLRAPLVRE